MLVLCIYLASIMDLPWFYHGTIMDLSRIYLASKQGIGRHSGGTRAWRRRFRRGGQGLAVSMQLEMGSTPASGVVARRPRRVARTRAESPNGESVRAAQKVTGEGASHGARGGRAPPVQHSYDLGGLRLCAAAARAREVGFENIRRASCGRCCGGRGQLRFGGSLRY